MQYIKGLIFLTLLLILSRVVPHPPNFTPILAGVIFLPFVRKDLTFSLTISLASMIITDAIIGMHSLMIWTYLPILLVSFFAYYFHEKSLLRVGSLAFFSPLLFFIISNFGVWLNSSNYAKNFSGLFECYFYGIPFYANSAISCILFSAIFFAIYKVSETRRIEQL